MAHIPQRYHSIAATAGDRRVSRKFTYAYRGKSAALRDAVLLLRQLKERLYEIPKEASTPPMLVGKFVL